MIEVGALCTENIHGSKYLLYLGDQYPRVSRAITDMHDERIPKGVGTDRMK